MYCFVYVLTLDIASQHNADYLKEQIRLWISRNDVMHGFGSLGGSLRVYGTIEHESKEITISKRNLFAKMLKDVKISLDVKVGVIRDEETVSMMEEDWYAEFKNK
jgi:hypothetical protein